MKSLESDQYHRTAKILVDQGLVDDVANAPKYLEDLILQIQVGTGIDTDLAAQAALFTAINTGRRAMLGGVRVEIQDNPILSLPWVSNQNLVDAVRSFGGEVVNEIDCRNPVLRIGHSCPSQSSESQIQLSAHWDGWCGGVIDSPSAESSAQATPLAGLVAGALGVSEIFQYFLGSSTAARRTVGLSLWRPDVCWQEPDATGPPLLYFPDRIWLLGLGHLGQAYAWGLGCLPYDRPHDLEVFLVDFDKIVEANHSTGLLTEMGDLGKHKTRVVASKIAGLGHQFRLVERRYDQNLMPDRDEPLLALAGFDKPEPRRNLGDKFDLAVDAGLGADHYGYLDILIHTFPSQLTPEEAFPTEGDGPMAEGVLGAAYEAEIDRRIRSGDAEGSARCGVFRACRSYPRSRIRRCHRWGPSTGRAPAPPSRRSAIRNAECRSP